jgi:hypothetical protein
MLQILVLLFLIFFGIRYIINFYNKIYFKTIHNNFRFSNGENKFEK